MRTPRVYFSFRSPYSWLALQRLRPDVEDDGLEYIPYWEPGDEIRARLQERGGGIHYAPMSKAKHLYILGDARRLARAAGLDITWPVDRDPCWDLPHLLWLHQAVAGCDPWPLYRALVAERWQNGGDISSEDSIRRVLERERLEGVDQLIEAASRDELVQHAADLMYDAWMDDIFGIPYFRAGFDRFWGYDRLDGFLDRIGRRGEGGSTPDGTDTCLRGAGDMPGSRILGDLDADSAGACG